MMARAWTPDMVIFHHPCNDGMGAALAASLRWPDAEYVPANYGVEPPDVSGLKVLIVDFSYKEPVLREMARRADSIIILDHHKTAAEDLEPFRFVGHPSQFTLASVASMFTGMAQANYLPIIALFDMERSGAMLAWNFAHPDQEPPPLIRAIEDRDLWRFAMPESKAIAARLRTVPNDLVSWAALLTQNFETLAEEGRAMLAYHESIVAEIAGKFEIGFIDDVLHARVNCPSFLASDVGNALIDKTEKGIGAVYSDSGGYRHWSLRSRDDRPDVSVIAKKYGGGGHRNAAGFRVPL